MATLVEVAMLLAACRQAQAKSAVILSLVTAEAIRDEVNKIQARRQFGIIDGSEALGD